MFGDMPGGGPEAAFQMLRAQARRQGDAEDAYVDDRPPLQLARELLHQARRGAGPEAAKHAAMAGAYASIAVAERLDEMLGRVPTVGAQHPTMISGQVQSAAPAGEPCAPGPLQQAALDPLQADQLWKRASARDVIHLSDGRTPETLRLRQVYLRHNPYTGHTITFRPVLCMLDTMENVEKLRRWFENWCARHTHDGVDPMIVTLDELTSDEDAPDPWDPASAGASELTLNFRPSPKENP
jgi:hypothetical protein